MMDFWHCHKPTLSDGNVVFTGADKGYAADNAIGPAPHVALVDNSHFLLHPPDCTGVRVSCFVNFSILLLLLGCICKAQIYSERSSGNKKEACSQQQSAL